MNNLCQSLILMFSLVSHSLLIIFTLLFILALEMITKHIFTAWKGELCRN